MKESDGLYYVLKALIVLFSVILLCIVLWFAVDEGYITLAAGRDKERYPIEVSCRREDMAIGESIHLSFQIISSYKVDKDNLQWVSSNPEVVLIEGNKATGVSPGEAEVYLTDGNVKSNILKLQCVIRATEVHITNKTDVLYIGEKYQLETLVQPDNATYKTVEYRSLNERIATVDENGMVKALSTGTTQIAICDRDKKCHDSFILHVRIKNVESIELDDKEIELVKGQSYILEANVLPLDASYREIEWESSNPEVAEVEAGSIKAVSEGTAEIMAITDRGAKTASCIVTVVKSGENGEVKYAADELKVRSGSSPDSGELCTISKYDSVQILKAMEGGLYKVRTSSGICGYVECSTSLLLDVKPTPTPTSTPTPTQTPKAADRDWEKIESIPGEYRIWDVPYINQFVEGYPTGCELVSAVMVLQYRGYQVTTNSLVSAIKMGSSKYKDESGIWYAGNPFKEFVGDPSKRRDNGSYGCFAEPVVDAIEKLIPECEVYDISGCSEEELFKCVAAGYPVIVWCVKDAGTLKDGVEWKYTDGSGSFKELVGEHCAVLTGYDDKYVYLNDPSAGRNARQSKDKFLNNWRQLYSQAIVIE